MTADLKCTLLNAENLFLLFDGELPSTFEQLSESEWQSHSHSTFRNKPLQKVLALQKAIKEMDPDIILFTEVGGEESLINFNRYFLEQNYKVALIEGNSDRSIDVGYLIHKRLPYHFDLISNKDRPLHFWYRHERKDPQLPSQKFSRDAVELHLFRNQREKPALIFLLTHLKSPLDPEGIDPLGTERREAEFKTLLEIYKELQAKFPQTPIAVCGDFNGNAGRTETDREFLNLYLESDLIDIFETLNIDTRERVTFYPIKSGTLLAPKQIDYIFLSTEAQKYLSQGEVYRYEISGRGRPLGPITQDERFRLPSDHYPITMTLRGLPF